MMVRADFLFVTLFVSLLLLIIFLSFTTVYLNQQMHTNRYNYNNVITRKLLHVSALTGPLSGSSQMRKTIL
jgi:hypothetical protein